MTIAGVRNQMHDMGLSGMLSILEGVLERHQKGDLHLLEALDELLEHEWEVRRERATKTRVQRSKIRKGASLEEYDFSLNRGISKAELRSLGKLEWCEQGKPLILIGPTGIGKTYLARCDLNLSHGV